MFNNTNLQLFSTGFLYVFGVAINTYLIAKVFYIGIFFTAFTLNWLWTSNIKKVNVSNSIGRFYYSLGAAIGAITGVFLIKNILNLWNI